MMLEEQIDDLKDKLDRKEYMIQYKEEIWSTFESELKKVIKKDSELYEKI
jgi:5-methylthioribose kinase